jgi:hypothetical protein
VSSGTRPSIDGSQEVAWFAANHTQPLCEYLRRILAAALCNKSLIMAENWNAFIWTTHNCVTKGSVTNFDVLTRELRRFRKPHPAAYVAWRMLLMRIVDLPKRGQGSIFGRLNVQHQEIMAVQPSPQGAPPTP